MRKSLLITSALGLISALPTFAMANAAAGSSAAACGSGFFAQFDAKIMNAKLEIKNEKGNKSTVEAPLPDTDEGVGAEIKGNLGKALATSELVGIFDFDVGANNAEKGAIFTALSGYSLTDTGKESADQLGIRIDASIAALKTAGTIAGGTTISADQRKNLIESVTVLRDLGVNGKLAPVTALGGVPAALKAAGENIVFVDRDIVGGTAEDAAAVVAKLTPTFITDGGKDFSVFSKVYVVSNELTGAPLKTADFQKAAKTLVEDKVRFKDLLDALAKTSATFRGLVDTKKEDNLKFNAQLKERKKLEILDRRVHHHALAGGIGATAGWWQNMGGFALSISGTGDYHWGRFKVADDASGSTVDAKDKRKLGFGFQGDVGAHYVVSPSTTLGVLVGIRGQQLQFGRTDKTATTTNNKDSKGDYASKWMWNPVVSAQARTFFTDTVYGALTVGYIIPMSERDYKLENTQIDKDAKVRLQGLTGAFSVGMMF